MCRNIKPLYNYEPPASDNDIRAASVQFVRKISGMSKPSKANEMAFRVAVDAIAAASNNLLLSLKTEAPVRNRLEEEIKNQTRNSLRFSQRS